MGPIGLIRLISPINFSKPHNLMRRTTILTLLLGVIWMATSCDKLENGDVELSGKWALSYRTTERLGFDFSYDYVIFRDDGTCAICYDGGEMRGTYRASDAVIRIEAQEDDLELMWKVLSMSPYKIVTEYEYAPTDGKHIIVTVTLERV